MSSGSWRILLWLFRDFAFNTKCQFDSGNGSEFVKRNKTSFNTYIVAISVYWFVSQTHLIDQKQFKNTKRVNVDSCCISGYCAVVTHWRGSPLPIPRKLSNHRANCCICSAPQSITAVRYSAGNG